MNQMLGCICSTLSTLVQQKLSFREKRVLEAEFYLFDFYAI